jgi:hypothetical protein
MTSDLDPIVTAMYASQLIIAKFSKWRLLFWGLNFTPVAELFVSNLTRDTCFLRRLILAPTQNRGTDSV